jgi:hypothetical protein
MSSLVASLPAPPDTGDVRADLLAFLEPAFGVFQSGVGFAMLGALLVKERDDPARSQRTVEAFSEDLPRAADVKLAPHE